MTHYSQPFLDEFTPTRKYHCEPKSLLEFNDVRWSVKQKQLIHTELGYALVSQREMAEYLQVNVNRIEKLVRDFKSGKSFSDAEGRPPKIDEEGKASLRQEILKRKDEKRPMTNSEFYLAANRVAQETDIRRDGNGLLVTVSKKTADKLLIELNASKEKGQTTTKARHRESRDIRNFISMATMNQAYASDKPPHMIGNYDATQFIVSVKNEELLITIKKEHLDGSRDDGDVPLTNVEDSALDFGVKWMMMGNALGHLGVSIFLVNDPNMDADDFHAYEILGLSHIVEPSAKGYLCFCKTRAGNAKFFQWYTMEILTKFVEACRDLLLDDQKAQSFYMIADGEQLQLQPFDDPEVLSTLDNFNIDLAKGPASCTNTIGNACDRSNLFKATKKTMKAVSSVNELDFQDPVLELKIFNTIQTDHSLLSVEKRRNICKGVVKIARSLAKVVNYQIVSHGFHRIGLYPVNAKKCISNMDAEALSNFDANTINGFVSKIPDLASLFLDESSGGQITEKQFDDLGIPQTESDDRRTIPKDQRCLSNQRAVMISHQASRKRRQDWLNKKAKSSPVLQETITQDDDSKPIAPSNKRKRAPNRPREVIEAEKAQKLARRQERELKGNQ